MGTPSAELSIGALSGEHARNFPDRCALADGDVRLSFAELDSRVTRLAGGLSARGIGPGSRILWLGQNSFRIIETLLAAAQLGAVLCVANWRQTVHELEFVLQDQDPAIIICHMHDTAGRYDELRASAAPSGTTWVYCGDSDHPGELRYDDLLAGTASPQTSQVSPDDPLLALYTAAYDGRPAAALISHQGIFVQNLVIALDAGIDGQYVYLNSGPLFHVSTLMHTLATFHVGGTNVIMPKFDAREFCRLVEQERCTGAFVAEPIIRAILENPNCAGYDLSSLRVPPGSDRWNARVTPVPTRTGARTGYGQTEVMGLATLRNLGGPATGSAGRPSPAIQLRVVDADGAEVPPGDTGEIVLRGPTVMLGYHRRPELNDYVQRGGWHHTRDLGRRELDGSLTFIGPMARLIKSGAENVYPVEVEVVLRKHPHVQDAAVIGVPDARWGQCVKAVIVPRAGAQPSLDDLKAHCARLIASYKKPTALALVAGLPRLGDGRLDYDRIDADHGGGGYPGAGGPVTGTPAAPSRRQANGASR